MAATPLIFYVEDDEHIRDLTSYALRQAGFEVRAFPDGEGFVEACRTEQPQAVLLDIMLPGTDGIQLLRQLRADAATENIPAMMLTAKGTEYDAVCGLDAGADDYLAKPFGMMELISRVNALLRRAARPATGGSGEGVTGGNESGPASGGVDASASEFSEMGGSNTTTTSDERITLGPIVLKPAAHRVKAGGVKVPLTVKEFALLRVLMENAGRVMTRDQLLADVWDVHYAGETRTVDAHVKTLRRKLAEACPGAEDAIVTVRGVGYLFQDGEEDAL